MKIKNKYILIIFFSVFIITTGYYFLSSNKDKAGNSVTDNLFGWKFPVTKFPLTGSGELSYSSIRKPTVIPEGFPVSLKIPILGVDSVIEDALITPDGRMDVPLGSKNVAWFALGPHPGDIGSAVIGGHFGIRNGVPFVFYKLDKLKIGDKIYILNDKTETLVFIVRSIKLFDRNSDATTVFTSNDGLAHLNLITCEGIWNQVNGSYPQRRVVFTDAISSDGVVFTNTISKSILRIGMHGANVAELQNKLIEKSFLVLPSGITKGYFGILTYTALSKYQISVGLKPDGIFGFLTRAKLIPEIFANSTLPNTGVDRVVLQDNENSLSLSQNFIQIIKSLYENPTDGFITSLLIALIIFMIFKIF